MNANHNWFDKKPGPGKSHNDYSTNFPILECREEEKRGSQIASMRRFFDWTWKEDKAM
jgi:hypothetical protein